MSSDKPFPPSTKRLKKLSQEGNVVRSKLLTYCVLWILSFLSLAVMFPLEFFRELIQCVENGSEATGILSSVEVGIRTVVYAVVFGVVLPGVCNVLFELFQARWSFASKAIRFSGDRLSIGSGFKRLGKAVVTSPGMFVRVCLSVCSLGFILYLIAAALPELVGRDDRIVLHAVRGWATVVWLPFAILLLVSGMAEYVIARRRYLRDNGMSIEELRREQKDDEGDPHVRAERRAAYEWLVKGDLTQRVIRSKVILVSRKRRNERSAQIGRTSR